MTNMVVNVRSLIPKWQQKYSHVLKHYHFITSLINEMIEMYVNIIIVKKMIM